MPWITLHWGWKWAFIATDLIGFLWVVWWLAVYRAPVSDTFPRRAVGSVVGMVGMAGAVGGMVIALIVGEILQRTGSYVPIFFMAGSAYLAALLIIHLLVPRLEPANV